MRQKTSAAIRETVARWRRRRGCGTISVLFAFAVFGTPGLATAQNFAPGDEIPAFVHDTGAGSRVDVRTDGTHAGPGWTVVFRRSLQTGDPDHDVQFTPGGIYSFQVTTWDNAGGDAHDTSEQANIYTMTIPASPGPLTFSGTPPLFSALSGQLLSSDEIEIVAAWDDPTQDDQRRRWAFDGTNWAQSADNEDRVAFIWDMEGDDFATTGNCAAMCHSPLMYTNAGQVDTWHWKATRTNPSGYADDKNWDDGMGGTVSGRLSDPGLEPYVSNGSGSLPAFRAETDPGANASFLFQVPEGMQEATPYAAGAWNLGDVLPGYVHRRGSGSRSDLFTTASYDGAGWSVTFRRKLDTGDTFGDIAFAAGGTYDFQVTTWDNAGGDAHDTSEQANIYTMTIPASPGPLTFPGTPPLFSALSGQLLSSDEIEITVGWSDSTQNDLRKQWQFDGANWSQSSENEDRVALIWDIQMDGFSSAGNCAAMCHSPLMYTAPGTFVDTWHWKAARTAPIGFTDDKNWDDGMGGTVSGRLSDPGTSVYKDNADVGGAPSYMSVSGPGNSATFLLDIPAATGWERAVALGPPPAPLDKDQQKCVKAMNKDGSKVDKAQFKDNEKCLKDFQNGKLLGPVEDCLTADLKGKVQKKKDKTVKDDDKKCVPLMPQPAFGYTGAQTVNDAGVEGPIDLFHTIFGDPANDNVFLIGKANKDSAKCQTDMLKQGNKLEDTVLKELAKAKNDAIKLDTVNSSATLGAAIALRLSSSSKIAKQEDNFLKKVSNSCSSLQVAASVAFPGICADDDPAVLTDCVIAAARCVACVKMNEFDGLTMNCDLGDNNAADGSCPLP